MYPYTLIVFLAFVLLVPCSAAQDGSGGADDASSNSVARATLDDWPAGLSSAPADTTLPFDLLPAIDRLVLDVSLEDAGGGVDVRYAIAWDVGRWGVLEGRKVRRRALPEDVRIASITLEATVVAATDTVGLLVLEADSIMLPPAPEVARLEARGLAWDALFAGASAADAEAAVRTGITLHNLVIRRIAFATFEAGRGGEDVRVGRPPPSRVRVHPVDIDLHVGWFFGGRDRWTRARGITTRPPVRGTRARGDTVGRSSGQSAGRATTERGGTREGTRDGTGEGEGAERGDDAEEARGATRRTGRRSGRDRGDDDDDDDDSLLPVAVGAAVAVGAVAVIGGTAGYYGYPGEAPLGLQAGYVRPEGGVLFQAAINYAVLEGEGEERLVAKVTGFGGLRGSMVQPSLGLGVQARAHGDTDWEPAVSLGLVLNRGAFVGSVAYDPFVGGVEVGLGLNFRWIRRAREQEEARGR